MLTLAQDKWQWYTLPYDFDCRACGTIKICTAVRPVTAFAMDDFSGCFSVGALHQLAL